MCPQYTDAPAVGYLTIKLQNSTWYKCLNLSLTGSCMYVHTFVQDIHSYPRTENQKTISPRHHPMRGHKTDFVNPFLLYCTPSPSEKESTLKGKNLLPIWANSFYLEMTPCSEGDKNNFDRAVYLQSISIPNEKYQQHHYSINRASTRTWYAFVMVCTGQSLGITRAGDDELVFYVCFNIISPLSCWIN